MWQVGEASIIRLIDWEKWTWGDPALDVGTVIASYLKLWLKSLIVNQNTAPSILRAHSRHLATIPRFPDASHAIYRSGVAREYSGEVALL